MALNRVPPFFASGEANSGRSEPSSQRSSAGIASGVAVTKNLPNSPAATRASSASWLSSPRSRASTTAGGRLGWFA